MTNLSKSFRKLVEDNFIINALVLSEAQVSKDKLDKSQIDERINEFKNLVSFN